MDLVAVREETKHFLLYSDPRGHLAGLLMDALTEIEKRDTEISKLRGRLTAFGARVDERIDTWVAERRELEQRLHEVREVHDHKLLNCPVCEALTTH